MTDVAEVLGIGRYLLVGHSMGGKVAQVEAGRRPPGLAGLVLVAPAPPTPMQVRAGMLASYQWREGVAEALKLLAGPGLDDARREQVIEDTLRGDADAKRSWTGDGMSLDVGAALVGIELPFEIVLAEHDWVERESVLRPAFARFLPSAAITTVFGAGHLIPLRRPTPLPKPVGAF